MTSASNWSLFRCFISFPPEPNVFNSVEQLESHDRVLVLADRSLLEVLDLLSEEFLLEQLVPLSYSRKTLSSRSVQPPSQDFLSVRSVRSLAYDSFERLFRSIARR